MSMARWKPWITLTLSPFFCDPGSFAWSPTPATLVLTRPDELLTSGKQSSPQVRYFSNVFPNSDVKDAC